MLIWYGRVIINSLTQVDIIWRHRTSSTLVQGLLTAPNASTNVVSSSKRSRHSPGDKFTETIQVISSSIILEIIRLELKPILTGDRDLISTARLDIVYYCLHMVDKAGVDEQI